MAVECIEFEEDGPIACRLKDRAVEDGPIACRLKDKAYRHDAGLLYCLHFRSLQLQCSQ